MCVLESADAVDDVVEPQQGILGLGMTLGTQYLFGLEAIKASLNRLSLNITLLLNPPSLKYDEVTPAHVDGVDS